MLHLYVNHNIIILSTIIKLTSSQKHVDILSNTEIDQNSGKSSDYFKWIPKLIPLDVGVPNTKAHQYFQSVNETLSKIPYDPNDLSHPHSFNGYKQATWYGENRNDNFEPQPWYLMAVAGSLITIFEGDFDRCEKDSQKSGRENDLTCDQRTAMDFCYRFGGELLLPDDMLMSYFDVMCTATGTDDTDIAVMACHGTKSL